MNVRPPPAHGVVGPGTSSVDDAARQRYISITRRRLILDKLLPSSIGDESALLTLVTFCY